MGMFCILITHASLVNVHGPVTQAHFLHSMGITTRLQMLLRHAGQDEMLRKQLVASYHRLVDPTAMGAVYKFLAMTPQNTPTPIAFEVSQPVYANENS
jgi:NADH dehydrogenase [ubiquinone] 1 alpha subcomplex assembly factor 7